MIDIYEQQDNNGREIFKSFCKVKHWCKHHKDATEQYSHWDTSYYSGKTMVVAEIKERNYDSSAFSDWYGEIYKYNQLMLIKDKYKAKGMDVKIHYINLFNDNQVIIWDLDLISPESFEMNLPKHTLEDNGNVNKKMYRLWKAQSILWEKIIDYAEPYGDEDDEDDLGF